MDFDTAFELVVGIEGDYSEDPKDPGNWSNGVLKGTKYGISAKYYPSLDIKNLTLTQAKEIYRRDYWNVTRCDDLPYALRLCVFDMAVNPGPGFAIKSLQKCVGVVRDGNFGPKTLVAVRSKNPVELFLDLSAERALRYIQDNQFVTYGRGWLRRCFRIALETGSDVS